MNVNLGYRNKQMKTTTTTTTSFFNLTYYFNCNEYIISKQFPFVLVCYYYFDDDDEVLKFFLNVNRLLRVTS